MCIVVIAGAGGDDDADGEADDEDNEDVEMPEDLEQYADNPKEQMRRVIYRSLYMMALGTIVVLLVSDPTVDVMSDLGERAAACTPRARLLSTLPPHARAGSPVDPRAGARRLPTRASSTTASRTRR